MPITHRFPLKEASQLTETRWAAVALHEAGDWQLGQVHQLTKNRQEVLRSFLRKAYSAAGLGGALAGGRPRSIRVSAADDLDCGWVYAFPAQDRQVVLVGVQDKLEAGPQKIWKLAAGLERVVQEVQAVQEVNLLQQTVLELQQTQQELQARISAQREAEARLIQAAKMAAVGEMAAGVAHELNNPLTTVVGFTELALEELPLDSPIRNDLELVLKEARRARNVVRRLLDFARQAESLRAKADLNEIVDDVLILTKHLLQTSGVQSEIRLGKDLPWVTVDRDQIKQVVINLVNNALYAMPEGGRLAVETAEQARYGQPWVTLTVRDTGVGIPAENLERIFEPFFTTRGDRGGTGLGLSVTYGIVTDHAGMIEVESQVQNGSAFTVWLPLEAAK
jgi:signal transduction histidine kinase